MGQIKKEKKKKIKKTGSVLLILFAGKIYCCQTAGRVIPHQRSFQLFSNE